MREHFLTWHKRLNLEALTSSNTELKWGCSNTKAKRVLFKTSCPAEAFCSLFNMKKLSWNPELWCLVYQFTLLYSTSYVRNLRASPGVQMSAVGSQWFLAAQRSFFSWIPPVKGFKFTIKQYHISCLLATSGPGTKFLLNSITVKAREAVLFLMLDVSRYDCSAINCLYLWSDHTL